MCAVACRASGRLSRLEQASDSARAGNYRGWLALEGTDTGDQLTNDARSAAYARGLIETE